MWAARSRLAATYFSLVRKVGKSQRLRLWGTVFPTPFLLTAPKETVSDRQRKALCWFCGASHSTTGAPGQDTRSVPLRCRSTALCFHAHTPTGCAWSVLLSRQTRQVDAPLPRVRTGADTPSGPRSCAWCGGHGSSDFEGSLVLAGRRRVVAAAYQIVQ